MILATSYLFNKRSWVEVDLAQLRRNYSILKTRVKKDVSIIAVVKADAYGHGAIEIAKTLQDSGVDFFAVANLDEAISLRMSGIKGDILILGYTPSVYCKEIYQYNFTQSIVSELHAQELKKSRYKIKVHFAVDTGMNRIGIDGSDTDLCERIIRTYYNNFNVTGIFTHLCASDSFNENDVNYTKQQICRFKRVVERLTDLDLHYVHYCNSAAALSVRDIEKISNIDTAIRMGIALYGLRPSDSFSLPYGVRPIMTWKSRISMIKSVSAGETIGYGRSYKANKQMKIATITTGYADGYNRRMSNKGHVLIRGKLAKVVGLICMDQFMVDITGIENVKAGDSVVLLGVSQGIEYGAEHMANEVGTISYEIVCNISKRVTREYIGRF